MDGLEIFKQLPPAPVALEMAVVNGKFHSTNYTTLQVSQTCASDSVLQREAFVIITMALPLMISGLAILLIQILGLLIHVQVLIQLVLFPMDPHVICIPGTLVTLLQARPILHRNTIRTILSQVPEPTTLQLHFKLGNRFLLL